MSHLALDGGKLSIYSMVDINESGVILPGENQKYFLLNINEGKKGKRENKVYKWIKEREFAPIFFCGHTIDQFKNKDKLEADQYNSKPHRHPDAESFVETFSKFSNTDDKIVFSIGEEKIYFFEQAGELRPYRGDKKDEVKGFKIKILKEIDIKGCPLVLASIKTNLHFALGTFKKLDETDNFGNIKAIKYALDSKKATINNFSDYLKCLSSVEFETLIAKILEEKGLFVSAYKGGFIKNFDLVCRNFGENQIEIGREKINKGDTKLIQIKLKLEKDYKKKSDYFYFCIDSEMKDKNVFDADYIEKTLLNNPKTFEWLNKSLCWIDKPC